MRTNLERAEIELDAEETAVYLNDSHRQHALMHDTVKYRALEISKLTGRVVVVLSDERTELNFYDSEVRYQLISGGFIE